MLEVITLRKETRKTVSLGLPEGCYNQLKSLADDTCRTVPSYIRMVLYAYLRRLDDPDIRAEDWWVVK